jgi:hypothetical protein
LQHITVCVLDDIFIINAFALCILCMPG